MRINIDLFAKHKFYEEIVHMKSRRVAINGILIATLRLEHVPKGRDKYSNIYFNIYFDGPSCLKA